LKEETISHVNNTLSSPPIKANGPLKGTWNPGVHEHPEELEPYEFKKDFNLAATNRTLHDT